MKVSARLTESNKYYIRKEVKDSYSKSALLEESEIDIVEQEIGHIAYKQIASSGMILIDAKMYFQLPTTDIFKIEGESIMMEFLYDSNSHNITFSKNYRGRFEMEAEKQIHFFIIILSKEYYFTLIPKSYSLHRNFVDNIFAQDTVSISETMLQFNPAIHNVIHEIKSCNRKGELKRLYIENKIQELLLLQLEVNQQQYLLLHQSGLNDKDYKKLLEAKHILDTNFKDAPRIAELARMSYLNEFKLKIGFKTCFGMTIKNYVISLRMKQAINLLSEDQHSITEIAYLCGYNGIVQFSSAFKTYYGYSPSFLRKVQ